LEAWKRSVRHGDDFDWLVGHSVNQEAPEVSLQGSWLLCTPSLIREELNLERITKLQFHFKLGLNCRDSKAEQKRALTKNIL